MTTWGFVFPGQGSQTVGMLGDLAQSFPLIKTTLEEGSDVLGYDLWRLTQEGPPDRLDKTEYTQPALLACSVALWRVIQQQAPIKPLALAGHSLGEYSALVCAGAIAFADALYLVARRGQAMQAAVPEGVGAMAAIVGLDDEAIERLCLAAVRQGEVLQPANFNCPGQVVIAGHRAAVERALGLAKDASAKLAKFLPVSVPSHCRLMEEAAASLQPLLASISIQPPTIPVINNVDVAFYTDASSIRDGLVRQLSQPVRWVETIQAFQKLSVDTIVECGPGKVLSGLMKRIDSAMMVYQANDRASLQSFLALA